MARATATVRAGVLSVNGLSSTIPIGEDSWWRWLEAPGTTTFRVEDAPASFTARREQRPGGWYWYAYRKRHGRLCKAYMGRSTELTVERLRDVARALANSDAQPVVARRPTGPQLRHNLPTPLSTFVGRDSQIAEVHEYLRRSDLDSLIADWRNAAGEKMRAEYTEALASTQK